MNERCWTLLGSRDPASGTWRVRLEHLVDGTPARVEADWSWTLSREESHGDVAGFYHTHPQGAGAGPSERDVRTMQAWCGALGKALLCLISEGDSAGSLQACLFENDENAGAPVASVAGSLDDVLTITER
ncbi:MAG TPA: Mov34/MPN/PAD-1 family protein [Spirochaetia bacterium]|nr:Mov34/MPN/PAD-1 family protein [Spirochaetia bacterium]